MIGSLSISASPTANIMMLHTQLMHMIATKIFNTLFPVDLFTPGPSLTSVSRIHLPKVARLLLTWIDASRSPYSQSASPVWSRIPGHEFLSLQIEDTNQPLYFLEHSELMLES
jgi:hypothetical protein